MLPTSVNTDKRTYYFDWRRSIFIIIWFLSAIIIYLFVTNLLLIAVELIVKPNVPNPENPFSAYWLLSIFFAGIFTILLPIFFIIFGISYKDKKYPKTKHSVISGAVIMVIIVGSSSFDLHFIYGFFCSTIGAILGGSIAGYGYANAGMKRKARQVKR